MSLEEEIATISIDRHLTLAVAESCTGGLLASRLTDVPGSSAFFIGGIVAYSNFAKEHLLGVPGRLIDEHGAVSREVALAMARGALKLMGTDLAIGITGIAGPTGGSPQKPVGLVYISLIADGYEECRECRWDGTRLQNKLQSTEEALSLLGDHLKKHCEDR